MVSAPVTARVSTTSSIVPHAPAGREAEIVTVAVPPAATRTASVVGVDQVRHPPSSKGADAVASPAVRVMRTSLAAFSPSPCIAADARYSPAARPVTCWLSVKEKAEPE